MHSSGDTVDDDDWKFDVLSKSKENMVMMMLMRMIFKSWICIFQSRRKHFDDDVDEDDI